MKKVIITLPDSATLLNVTAHIVEVDGCENYKHESIDLKDYKEVNIAIG